MPGLSGVDSGAVDKFLNMLTVEKILSSLLLLILCIVIIKISMRIIKRVMKHTPLDKRLEKFILTSLRVVMYVVTVIIVAQTLGIPSTSLVALLSVGALAVSLAVQGMLSNVAGGMMLLTSRPISLGDYVEVAGVTGYVDEVGMLYTKLHTDDGQMIMLPNSSISNERITNFTTLGRRRIVLSIGTSYDAAVEDVRAALLEAAANVPELLDDPAPEVCVNAYLDSAIEFHIYAWCPWNIYRPTRQKLNETVKAALDQRGIEIPYNHLNVHIMQDSCMTVDQK